MFCCISVVSASLHCHSRQRSGTLVAAHRHNSMPLDIHRLLRSAVPQRAESVGGADGGVLLQKRAYGNPLNHQKPCVVRALPQRAEPLGGAAGGVPAANTCCKLPTNNHKHSRKPHMLSASQCTATAGRAGRWLWRRRTCCWTVAGRSSSLWTSSAPPARRRRPTQVRSPLGTALGLTCTWAGLGLSARVQGLDTFSPEHPHWSQLHHRVPEGAAAAEAAAAWRLRGVG